jgi:RNA polymerase sigma factor, sigma-70 family
MATTLVGTGPCRLEDTRTDSTAEDPLKVLFVRLAGGDLTALEEIWDLAGRDVHAHALWRTGSREDAEDATQEVFVRLARAGRSLGRVERPRRYLAAMTHRACVDFRRSDRRQAGPPPDFVEPRDEGDPGRMIDARRVSEALADLPPVQRETVWLRQFGEMSFREIGRATGVPTFTAATRYRLGIAKLRKRLGTSQ